jgi:hypothetical protein
MDMTGERRIPAPRARVWAALNDPEMLKASIPGCKSLERVGEDAYRATASVRLGPIAANFAGDVTLRDLNPPASYRIEGSGQGGPAGYAKGGADVTLAEDGEVTLLSYAVSAEIGGKLAQLGARLIDASAKQMADQFFDRFTEALAAPALPAAAPDAALPQPVPAAPAFLLFGLRPVFWIGAAIYVLILLMLFG